MITIWFIYLLFSLFMSLIFLRNKWVLGIKWGLGIKVSSVLNSLFSVIYSLSLRARETAAVQERRLHEPALQGEVALQRILQGAAVLPGPCAGVPGVRTLVDCDSVCLWGGISQHLNCFISVWTDGLSPSWSCGWMRTRKFPEISCTALWSGTQRTG